MGNGLLFSWYVMFSVAFATISKEFVVSRDSVPIIFGRQDCISDCSHNSSGDSNSTLLCSVDECKVLEESENSAQTSEVEKNDIHFERYTDEVEGTYKLALYFKWSPVDNVSLEKTKGYLINITDGSSSYSVCYNMKMPMNFHANAHDLFYNDCFGKVKGTNLTLGSKIVVRITPLPLYVGDREDGMATFTVEVPTCEREELHAFSECQKSGGRPTTQSCATDCRSYSEVNGVTHPVHCTLSKSSIQNIAGKEKCDKVNKPMTGLPPTPPKHVEKDQEWYKYKDLHGNVNIALNFSWMPRVDSSIEQLHGYYLEITPASTNDFTNYNKCFAIHTNLTELEHSKTEFFHDCYGRGTSKIKPGDRFHIHLNSIPQGQQRENFYIKVPDCLDNEKDEREEMEDVTYCIKENKKSLLGTVDEIFCQNRSMKYTYHISPDYGRFADIVFCERGPIMKWCDTKIIRMENLAPNNTLYNISLPSSADLSLNYSIFVHGSNQGGRRYMDYPNFSKCIKKAESGLSTVMLVLILVVGMSCVICLVFLVCFVCKKNSLRKFFRKYGTSRSPPQGRNVNVPLETAPIPIEIFDCVRPQPAVIPERLRVYVVFMDDHSMHRDVVHWFCSYLQQDLGLHVKLNICDTGEVSTSPVGYMLSNVKNADKVVVICSEGTKHCLSKTEYDGDMFTPVVKSICNQTFIGNNPGKFLVGYFDYSKGTDVPELLRSHCQMYFSLFKLMKHFEQFYFRLIGVEQFQEGGIQRIDKIAFDRYYDPTLTSCGKNLKEAIDRMKFFVRDNPTWYTDEYGSDQPQTSLPPQPIPRPLYGSIIQHGSILDPDPGLASISHLHAAPPPELHNGVVAASQFPHAEQQRPQNDPVPKPGKYQPLISMTSTSTDSSFIVPDTDTEDLSLSPGIDSSEQEHYHYPPRRHTSSDLSSAFAPGSFQEQDYATIDDNSSNSRLLENRKSVTRIGLTQSMEKLRKAGALVDLSPFLPVNSEEEEATENLAGISPESGVFTLADIEQQFKSINSIGFDEQV